MTKTLVVIDDDPTLLSLLEESLRLMGAAVQAFESAEEAQAIRWDGVDAAIIDWMMPGMDGVEFARWLRDTHPEVSRVVLTAAPDALMAAEPGVKEFARVVAKTEFPSGLYRVLGLA